MRAVITRRRRGGESQGSGILFEDDWSGLPTGTMTEGNFESTFGMVTRGWASASLPNTPDVVDRDDMPAEALAAAECPAEKTRFMYFSQFADEWLGLLNWVPASGLDEVYVSWWEFRPPNNNGVNNKIGRIRITTGDVHDFILEIQGGGSGASESVSPIIFENSGEGSGLSDYGSITWNGNQWRHIEWYIRRSFTTNGADGIARLWVDGVLNIDNDDLVWNDSAGDASEQINEVAIGGWVSAGAYPPSTGPWPRYIGAARIASSRQGVWSMT